MKITHRITFALKPLLKGRFFDSDFVYEQIQKFTFIRHKFDFQRVLIVIQKRDAIYHRRHCLPFLYLWFYHFLLNIYTWLLCTAFCTILFVCCLLFICPLSRVQIVCGCTFLHCDCTACLWRIVAIPGQARGVIGTQELALCKWACYSPSSGEGVRECPVSVPASFCCWFIGEKWWKSRPYC